MLVKRHIRLGAPHYGFQEMAKGFLKTTMIGSSDIADNINQQLSDDRLRNRNILTSVIKTLILCGRQNLPIRGHTDETSNFRALLEFKAENDDLLRKHLNSQSPRYVSPTVQNELLNICGNIIRDKVVSTCNNAQYFTVIADETTDKSAKEQLCICVRYVNKIGDAEEHFLGFEMAESVKGEALANLIVNSLGMYGVQLEHMVGQGYDGAANMSAQYKGVQARIQKLQPQATYVHCKAHCLNLAIVHACKDAVITYVLDKIQDIAFALTLNAKKLLAFQENLKEAPINIKEEMGRKTKLQKLCETRWAARANSLNTFRVCYSVIVDTLDELSHDGDSKALDRYRSICRFDFILPLVVAEHILQQTVPLSDFLQTKNTDLVKATEEANVVIRTLQNKRDDDTWSILYAKATEMAAAIGEEPNKPRTVGRQRNRNNVPADSI